jgi:hypothetical protein
VTPYRINSQGARKKLSEQLGSITCSEKKSNSSTVAVSLMTGIRDELTRRKKLKRKWSRIAGHIYIPRTRKIPSH